MFDKKKFMVIMFWFSELDVYNMDVFWVLIWVRVMELDLKCWGKFTLMKIVLIIGKPIKTDRTTAMKDLLYYVRIFIEVCIDDDLFDKIFFENE